MNSSNNSRVYECRDYECRDYKCKVYECRDYKCEFVMALLLATARSLFLLCIIGTAINLYPNQKLYAQKAFKWNIAKYNGQDYIPLRTNVKDFYQFESANRSSKSLIMKGAGLTLKFLAGRHNFYVNNMLFVLSYPSVTISGKLHISKLDLVKVVDPILHAQSLKNAELFDTVVIDPGHGGKDSGMKGIDDLEKNVVLDISKRLREALIAKGIKAKLTRNGDYYISLEKRVDISNKTPKSIYISVHCNSARSKRAQGLETYVLTPAGASSFSGKSAQNDNVIFVGNQKDRENIALAAAIHYKLVTNIQDMKDRGVKRSRFHVLRGSDKPSVLVECGFLSNPGDSNKMNKEEYRQKVAESIAAGIANYRNAIRKAQISG